MLRGWHLDSDGGDSASKKMEKVPGSGELDAVQRFVRRLQIMGAHGNLFEISKVWLNHKASGGGFEKRFCPIVY